MPCPKCGSEDVIEHDVSNTPILPRYKCYCQRCDHVWEHR